MQCIVGNWGSLLFLGRREEGRERERQRQGDTETEEEEQG